MEKYFQYLRSHEDFFVSIRQDIHQNPELGFDEKRTSKIVEKLLNEWGYTVHTGYGDTGLVGVLKRGTGKKRIGIRADMDALPIQEKTNLPYSSSKPNTMHACGHDGHTAMLLAAAKYLAEKGEFSGTLNLIFQPAEEALNGAKRMIEDGLFSDHPCDAVFGMHNAPGYRQGTFLFRSGPTLSASDRVTITLRGVGGHGAYPHLTKDPVLAAASIIMALQSIVSRNVSPKEHAVITVGAIHAGEASNVIPETATLKLSIRTLNPEIRTLIETRIKDLVNMQAHSYGVTADIEYIHGCPVLINSKAETDFAQQVATKLVGPADVSETESRYGSEDFAYMLEEVPGCYLFIGNGEGSAHGSCHVHSPHYDFNDKNIIVGGAYWACLAEEYLK